MSIYLYLTLQMLILWVVSLKIEDTSLFDRVWGLSFVVIVFLLFPYKEPSLSQFMLIGMVTLWGLRLSWFIHRRNQGKGEDRRYRAIRGRYPGYEWKSLFMIFGFQSLLVVVVSMPLWFILSSDHQMFTLWNGLGFSLWLGGWALELVADRQMKLYREGKCFHGPIMDRGVWAFSRHPNYLGECLLWWGFYVYCSDVAPWWAITSPVLMTWLLMSFTGIAPLEEDLQARKPLYKDYMRRVPAFFPKLF